MLSSHLLSDLERVCDHLVVLANGQVRVDGPVEELLASHKLLTGPRRDPSSLPRDQQVIQASHTDRQTTMLVRTDQPILDPPGWSPTSASRSSCSPTCPDRADAPASPGAAAVRS